MLKVQTDGTISGSAATELDVCMRVCVCTKSLQSCPTLCDPMDHSSPGFSVPGDSPGKNIGVSGLPCPPPGDLLDPGIKPASPASCIGSLALDTFSLYCPLLVAHTMKNLQHRRPRFDLWVGKIPLEKRMATHSSILAWRIPGTEEPGGLQSMR